MAIIFPFEANWQDQISVDREYKTEIIQSGDLSEQRKALRQEPRRRFEFSVQTTPDRADDAWQFFESRAQDDFIIPDFTRTLLLRNAAQKNSKQVTILGASEAPWLTPGAKLIIGSPKRARLPVMPQASKDVGSIWKYKVEPASSVADYSAKNYDDSTWSEGPGGFGEGFGHTPVEGTYVDPGIGVSIWIRFTLPEGPPDEGFSLTLWHDDGPELWVDGVSAPLPAQNFDYFRSRVYVPAKNTPQKIAYKVTDSVPAGNPSYIYAGVSWTSTIPEAEIVDVVSVSGDTVTISNVTVDRPAGALVRPAVYGRLDQNIQGSFETLTSGAWSVTFIEDPNDTYREVYASAPDARFFDGREVFLRKPNWMERASPAVQGYLETLAMDRGVFSHRNGQAFNLRLWDATYRNMDADAVEDLIQFVHRNRGRRGEFWMPTFRRDLKPVGVSAKDGYYLLVEGLETVYRLTGSRRLMVAHHGGAYEFHEIESVAEDGGNTLIRLRDPLAATVSGSGDYPTRISHMPLWRLATDTLSIQSSTTRVSDAKISMQQITLDENYDGHYPIATIANAGDATYNISGYKFISTAETKGRAAIRWDRVATRISTGDPATATLSVRVRCRSGANTVLRDETISITGYGLVSLDDYVDIPAATVYVQLNFTTTSAVPADTTVAAATIKTLEIRGRP